MLVVDLIQVKPAMSKVIGTPCWILPKIYLSFRHTKLIHELTLVSFSFYRLTGPSTTMHRYCLFFQQLFIPSIFSHSETKGKKKKRQDFLKILSCTTASVGRREKIRGK